MTQKILVVEDNELNLKLFCDLLRAHGYEAEPVRDGREAVERARAFAPDLVVMDIQMPHISGLELIEQYKADAGLRPVSASRRLARSPSLKIQPSAWSASASGLAFVSCFVIA